MLLLKPSSRHLRRAAHPCSNVWAERSLRVSSPMPRRTTSAASTSVSTRAAKQEDRELAPPPPRTGQEKLAARMRILGLEPSPELVAIAMGVWVWLSCVRATLCVAHTVPGLPARTCTTAAFMSKVLQRQHPEPTRARAVYFVQGILGLSRLALSFFFKDTLRVEPAEVGWG